MNDKFSLMEAMTFLNEHIEFLVAEHGFGAMICTPRDVVEIIKDRDGWLAKESRLTREAWLTRKQDALAQPTPAAQRKAQAKKAKK